VGFRTGKKSLNVCGPQISRLRSELGWSQPQFAAKCQLRGWDVSRDIIARIEGQTRWIGDVELAVLAKVLNVRLEKLYPQAIRSGLPK
jgi:transcriptional regulator with XRE-family HTH domain